MIRASNLTSLRGVSSLWVFAYHSNILLLGWANAPILSSGYFGVTVFFILSISLLLQSLDRNPDLTRYFTRRITRIWPMYFATVVMVFLYEAQSVTWLAEQLSFTATYIDNPGIHYVFWSLQVEEVAYLFFPSIHKLSASTKYKLGLILYFAGVASLFPIFWGESEATIAQWWWLPLSLSAYGMGILVYLRRVPALTIPLLFFIIFFGEPDIFSAASCLLAPGLAYIVQESGRFKILESKLLVKVGDISYGLYLVHWLLILALGWVGVALSIPVAWAFEKTNSLLIGRLRKQ